jgi:hypothetical protein
MGLSLTELASIQPNPQAWPQCPTCHHPYVLRRTMVFLTDKPCKLEDQWVWQRDCKHRTPPVVATAKGNKGRKRAKR